MHIGEFSRICKISKESIRFYEKEGLLKGSRKENNYRVYSKKEIRVVELINSLKNSGFTLSEIKSFLNLYDSDSKCKEVQIKLENKLLIIKNRISELRSIQEKLNESILECEENPNKKFCNIISSSLI